MPGCWARVSRGVLAGLALVASAAASAAELLYVGDARCAPCLLFDREIGPVYPKTAEARRIPLRRLAYGAPAPDPFAFIGQPRVAPTFVLVDQGRELGRFEGYSNDELFWMNLAALTQRLPGDAVPD